MRFGFLGLDAETLELAQTARELGHQLTAACEVPSELADEWAAVAPQARRLEDWQVLLGDEAIEAVVVSRGANDDLRADQLRLLFQSGMPLIVAHPIHDSMLVYYELDMVRQESNPVILPYAPEVWHPAIERLAELAEPESGSPLGTVEQISLERELADRSRRNVIAHFARDVEVLRTLAGPLDQVSAMASRSGSSESYESLTVQMSGPAGRLVRWSVLPAGHEPGAKLVVVGRLAKATLEMFEDQPWRLVRSAAPGPSAPRNDETTTFENWFAGEAALANFARVLGGETVHPTWIEAAQDLELVDAIDRSLRRGRTVDLHFEEHTEHGTFKGLMAAGGCGVLMAALLLVIVATTAVNLGVRVAAIWPYALLGLLLMFLLVQLLKLAFPSER